MTTRSQIWDGSQWVGMTAGQEPNHDNLINVTSSQHHARYTDAEAQSAVDDGTYLKLTGGALTGDLSIGGAFLRDVADPINDTHVGDRFYNDARYNFNRWVNAVQVSTTLTAGIGANQLVQNLTVPTPYLDTKWMLNASGYIDASVGGVTVTWTLTLRWAGGTPVIIQQIDVTGTSSTKIPFSFSEISEPPSAEAGGLEIVAQRDDISGTQIINSLSLTAHRVGT